LEGNELKLTLYVVISVPLYKNQKKLFLLLVDNFKNDSIGFEKGIDHAF
jgi:hypothetical protein